MIRAPAAKACARRILENALEDHPEVMSDILVNLAATILQNSVRSDEEAQEREAKSTGLRLVRRES